MRITRVVCIEVLVLIIIATGCNSPDAPADPASDCASNGLTIVPTATRQTDPDLWNPPGPPPGGGDPDGCPPAAATATPDEPAPTGLVTTAVSNLSLDEPGQALADVAMGDDMMAVTDTSRAVAVSAWGRAMAAPEAALSLRLGIDPRGGDDPASPDVVWSDAAAPDAFRSFSASVPAAGDSATLFLDATQNEAGAAAFAIWDAIGGDNVALTGGDFEGPFTGPNGRHIPEGWTPYYEDQGGTPAAARDVYTVYAAWSDDGGSTWTGPEIVAANRTPSGGVSGAIRPAVFPLITPETETPSASFIYIYETGDPPPGSDFIRFGRPHVTVCELGAAACSDPPGVPLLPRDVVRPTTRLALAPDPFHPGRALLSWDGLQADVTRRDIYASYLTLR